MSRTIIVLLFALMIFSAQTSEKLVCNGKNEENRCGPACQITCSNLDKSCPIISMKCNDACYCETGYVRVSDDNNTCISISECSQK
ncbi:hypothetical protein ACFW04_010419 [Cataglyphis niger]